MILTQDSITDSASTSMMILRGSFDGEIRGGCVLSCAK